MEDAQEGAMDKNDLNFWQEALNSISNQWISSCRWFQQKAEPIRGVYLFDWLELTELIDIKNARLALLFVNIKTTESPLNLYLIPLLVHGNKKIEEAMELAQFHVVFQNLLKNNKKIKTNNGNLILSSSTPCTFQANILSQTSTNSVIRLKADEVIKYYRHLFPGKSTELEMNIYLSKCKNFRNIPPLEGWVTYRHKSGNTFIVAISHKFIKNEGTLWEITQNHLTCLLQKILKGSRKTFHTLSSGGDERQIKLVENSARITAQMHRCLLSADSTESFRPEQLTREDLKLWHEKILLYTKKTFSSKEIKKSLPSNSAEIFCSISDALRQVLELNPKGWKKCRIHGDYHMGQILVSGYTLYIIDFEGEPLKDVKSRKALMPFLKDVAGMIRSFHYAIEVAFRNLSKEVDAANPILPEIKNILTEWYNHMEKRFLKLYFNTLKYNPSKEEIKFLNLLKLEKAIYELSYEVNNRPTWTEIALSGIEKCLDAIKP